MMDDRRRVDFGCGEREFHVDEHVCLDMLYGCLSPEEEEKLFSHLTVCSGCERLFRDMASDKAHREATRVLRTAPDGGLALERRGTAIREIVIERREAEEREYGKGFSLAQLLTNFVAGFRSPRLRLAGAAVAAVAVFTVVLVMKYTGGPDTPELYRLPPYSFHLQTRDAAGAIDAVDLEGGIEAYERGDFERSVELLDRAGEIELDVTQGILRRIYLGNALAWQGKYDEAVKVLEGVSFPLLPDEWSGEAQWTLYVALRRSGRETDADSLLRDLASKTGEVGDRARRLTQR